MKAVGADALQETALLEQNGACLEAAGLSFAYKHGHPVFSGIGFRLRRGEALVLIGPNGSGKTTLLNCVCGLLKPASGSVRLFGEDIATMSASETARRMAFLPQASPSAFDFTVLDYLVMGRAPYIGFGMSPKAADYEKARSLLERLGIRHLASMPCTQISGGERQQARIGRVLMQGSRLILMDEPTNHLDYGNQIKMLRLIDRLVKEGYAVVMTSHVPDHAIMLGSQVGVIGKDGSFLLGDAGELLSETLLSELYGADIRIRYMEEFNRNVCIPGYFRDG
jgi:iron complex transport system ATP-binding protein